jgi:steroid 5-alpha reductase family enzyme
MTSQSASLVVAAASGLAASLAIATLVWAASLMVRKASIVDIFWSCLVFGPALAYKFLLEPASPQPIRTAGVMLLTAVWAVRLSTYIAWRNWGQPEDRRYQQIRARNEPGFALKSLYLVFGLQAVLAWIVSMPLLAALSGRNATGWLDAAGAAIAAAGIGCEAVADWQLARFKAGGPPPGAVMDRGLWRYTRHPNYFGEFLVWWGLYLIAAAAGGAWSIVSPLLMSALLLRVSGVTLLEADLAARKPQYRAYVARTNAFFPGPGREPK